MIQVSEGIYVPLAGNHVVHVDPAVEWYPGFAHWFAEACKLAGIPADAKITQVYDVSLGVDIITG